MATKIVNRGHLFRARALDKSHYDNVLSREAPGTTLALSIFMATSALRTITETPSFAEELLASMTQIGRVPVRWRVGRGEILSLSDGRGTGVHVLASGRVKVLRFSDEGRVMLLDLVKMGEVFGDVGLSPEHGTDRDAPTYAEALEASELLSVPRRTFSRLIGSRPALALRSAELLAERCSRLEKRLESQVFDRVSTRLGEELLELARRFGVPDIDGTALDLSLSQQDLGNLIGASREIVSLTLGEFKRSGLVSTRGRRLVVDERALREALDADRLTA